MPSVAHALASSALPPLEARALLAHVSGLTRESLIAFPERELDEQLCARFADLCARRRAGEPLAYLVGEKEFYGRAFQVAPSVLIPRPETELLVEATLAVAQGRRDLRVLDLGTGSGCIAITLALELPGAVVTAVDQSAEALTLASRNADALGAVVNFVQSDWFSHVQGRFDLMVSNPPYIAAADPHLSALRFEPTQALTDHADGLHCLRQIAQGAPTHLAPGGWLLMEHGFDQGAAVRALLMQSGFSQAHTRCDLAGLERVTAGQSH